MKKNIPDTSSETTPGISRRRFFKTAAITGSGLSFGVKKLAADTTSSVAKSSSLAGPKPRSHSFPAWPIFDKREDEKLLEALHSGRWGRLNGSKVAAFESAYKTLSGAKHCLAVSSGTTALLTSLGALQIGPGDEVILPPYTFVATYNAITFHYALPVFVDSDLTSFQIDAQKISPAITPDTKLILPVHLGGSTPDMDFILNIANTRKIPVIEDACQAHLAEWRGRFVGQSGMAGCFSFQSSKNLCAGEGGAIITNHDDFAERCFKFHNQGRDQSIVPRGGNFRMTEFQGSLLLAQLTRLEAQSATRDQNAAYLTKILSEIPGIAPARSPEGCTRSSHHLYMFRYEKEKFGGLSRDGFIAAMAREGFACASGYTALNTSDYVKALATNPHYLRVYGEKTMKDWMERNQCPVNDRICSEAVWFTQTTLLGTKSDMDRIAESIRKIQERKPVKA